MPRSDSVGPAWLPSAVWLYTTSRITSKPALCRSLTICLNSRSTSIAVDGLRGIARLRREEAERVVAPIVGEALVDEMTVVQEIMHRHELDRRDAERAQVREHGLGGHPGIGAAQLLGHVRVQLRHAADVRLVDDGLVRQVRRALLAAPVERGIDHRGERRERRTIALVERQVALGVAELVGEQLVRPLQRPPDRLRIGIEQELRGIEAQPGVRIVRSVHTIAVELSGLDVGQVQVPGAVRSLPNPHAGLVLARCIEQAQLDRFRAFGEQREIDAAAVAGRSPRERRALRLLRPFALRGRRIHCGFRAQSSTALG